MQIPVLAAALGTGTAEGRAEPVQQREQPGPLVGPGKQSRGGLLIITASTSFALLANNPDNTGHQILFDDYTT